MHDECFSNFAVHKGHRGTLLKCRLWLSGCVVEAAAWRITSEWKGEGKFLGLLQWRSHLRCQLKIQNLCHSSIPQTGWFKQQEVWESKSEVLVGFGFLCGRSPWLVNGSLLAAFHMTFLVPCGSLASLCVSCYPPP